MTSYAIRLTNKISGESINLGSKFPSFQDAKDFADKDCCDRCNRIDIYPIGEGAIWRNKKNGFSYE